MVILELKSDGDKLYEQEPNRLVSAYHELGERCRWFPVKVQPCTRCLNEDKPLRHFHECRLVASEVHHLQWMRMRNSTTKIELKHSHTIVNYWAGCVHEETT